MRAIAVVIYSAVRTFAASRVDDDVVGMPLHYAQGGPRALDRCDRPGERRGGAGSDRGSGGDGDLTSRLSFGRPLPCLLGAPSGGEVGELGSRGFSALRLLACAADEGPGISAIGDSSGCWCAGRLPRSER
ncbi:hypothetical protein RHA1_ro03219 [Rhodococcus jostii RHA1]|uniref:Uncharacterized protein n=1 Tax=Rhodococcus jostii (strain RHA1) TaxID=101510 RepID=Q0SBR4_RHOJR|nr:hypothetical protein RHA1_ro03219 [Rhodococcus jostii RHA1]